MLCPIVEIERRSARVEGIRRVGGARQPRGGVEGHIVVEELPEERRPSRVTRVVGVVGAQGEVDDQCLGPSRERIRGVEQAAGPAELAQRRLNLRALRCERRQPEHAPETVGTDGGGGVGAGPLTRRRHDACRVEGHGARARTLGAQEPPTAEPVLVLRGHRCWSSSRSRDTGPRPPARAGSRIQAGRCGGGAVRRCRQVRSRPRR
jgi:hypothetical protein